MLIQVNTDHNIQGRERLVAEVEATVESHLDRFEEYLTRVEVHLGDENGKKGGGQDKRCMIEARIEGHQPVAVTHLADTLSQAMDGAAKKMKASLTSTIGRLSKR